MRTCHYCGKDELCGVGADNIPVCEDHYDKYLTAKTQEIGNAFKSLQYPSDTTGDTTGAGAQGSVTTPSEPAPEEL